MATFGFTEEQEMLRQEVRRFAQKELAPTAWARMQPDFADVELTMNIMNKFIQQGWDRLNFPERVGGWTLDLVSTCIIEEELCKADPYMGAFPFLTTFSGMDLKHLPEEVQDEVAPQWMNLSGGPAHGYTEADSGNDFTTIKTRAVRDGDHYVINGEKQPTSMGMFATHIIVTAKTDPSAGHKGMSMFLIPRDTPGLTLSSLPFILGNLDLPKGDPMRGHGNAIVSLDDVRVPAKYRLGEEGDGYEMLQEVYTWARTAAITLPVLADAQTSLKETIEWAKQRVHFGRPIIQFEGVSFRIADHYTNIEAARLLLYQALWLKDQGLPHEKEVSMAKMFGMTAGERCLHDCLMILGYAAYSSEHPMQERYRRAFGVELCDGADQIQKLLILKELIGAEALPTGMTDKF
jgi:alkylation response protein AidB-like acyl-CoA dehydrogenase